jgi:hypothetical protein
MAGIFDDYVATAKVSSEGSLPRKKNYLFSAGTVVV